MKFFVVLYLLLLTFIGGSVIFLTVRTVPIATAFRLSLITTMPFLEVDKEKTERLLNGLPNSVLIYLHVQKLFGWALALILVAALAGLTQQG